MIIQPPQFQQSSLRSPEDQLRYARDVLCAEAEALQLVAERLDETFCRVVDLIQNCSGRVGITGTGKSADVGQKLAGTLNSTGTRSYHFDATRAVHGDLGMIDSQDVIVVLSHSGESEEIVRLLPSLRQLNVKVVGLTGNTNSTLAQQSHYALVYGPLEEVCPLGLAPSSSTTVMLAIGDALAFVLCRLREFTREDFARFHPAGSLGRKLLHVDEVMRCGRHIRIASDRSTVREVFAQVPQQTRRTGAVMLINSDGKLSGLFTDSDLARLFEHRQDHALDRPIQEVMTSNPICIKSGAKLGQAADLLRRHKISELPVVDQDSHPIGLLDVTDLIGLLSHQDVSESSERSVA